MSWTNFAVTISAIGSWCDRCCSMGSERKNSFGKRSGHNERHGCAVRPRRPSICCWQSVLRSGRPTAAGNGLKRRQLLVQLLAPPPPKLDHHDLDVMTARTYECAPVVTGLGRLNLRNPHHAVTRRAGGVYQCIHCRGTFHWKSMGVPVDWSR